LDILWTLENAEMAQTIRDASLETRTARRKLTQRGKPYSAKLDRGVFLDYRKNLTGGTWWARLYDEAKRNYRAVSLGAADDAADPDGVTILSFSQAQAAVRNSRERMMRAALGLGEPMPSNYTVAHVMTDYVSWLEKEGRESRSTRDIGSMIQAHIIPTLGHVRADRLTTAQMQSWLEALTKQPPRKRTKVGAVQAHLLVDMADSDMRRRRRLTANRIFATLRAALNRAWRAGKIADDGAWRKVKPFPNVAVSRARYFTRDECERLLNACATDPAFRDLLMGALYSGARYSELCRMVITDFNPDAQTVRVLFSKSGKPRNIHLDAEGAAFFEQQAIKARACRYLFSRNGKPWAPGFQSNPMKAACKAASIGPAAGFHTLRHTWASHSIMNGMQIKVVAENLGHADTRMVELHYGHLAPSYKAQQVRDHAPRFGFTQAGVITPLRRAARAR
jgi:integrase